VTATNVTFQGGSPALVAALLAAHGAAATALAGAQGAAANGGGGFATWFGAPAGAPEVAVASALGQASDFLARATFEYQLDASLPQVVVADVYVVFAAAVDNTVQAAAWDFLPNLLAIDPSGTPRRLASSVAHEALVGSQAGVEDLARVDDAAAAAAVASISPHDAMRSARSYLCFLQQYVPSVQ
jgi:hypothetical protein